jgi:hypothetical protein
VGLCGLLVAAALAVGYLLINAQARAQGLLSATPGPARRHQVAARIAGLRVVNYYPAANGWTRMWTNWQPTVLRRDFARIHALGANAVRVVVFPNTFGWPTPSRVMAARFADVLSMAAANGLGVQVTLFDQWAAFNEIAASRAWLRALLRPYAADPEIQLAELKNEVDPANALEVAWLRALLPALASVLPGTPTTVSVSGTVGPSGFAQLRSQLRGAPLDVADMHFYGSEQSAYSWMLSAKRAAGQLPLFVGEAGDAVNDTAAGPAAAGLDQAHWFSVVFAAARAAGVPAPGPWTLNDFAPGTVPGASLVSSENHFGLYTMTGRARPAAQVVREAFSGRSTSTSNLDFTQAGNDGQPMVWSRYLPTQGTLAYDPRVGRRRPGSVRLSATQISWRGAPSYYLVPDNPPLPGQLWQVSVWATGSHVNGTAQLALAWFSSRGSFLGDSSSGPLPQGNPGWTQLLVRARVPAGATSVQINLKSYGVTGTVWFTDVGVTVGSGIAGAPPGPTPSVTPSPAPAPTGVPLSDGERAGGSSGSAS